MRQGFVDEETMAKWKTKRKGGATPYGYVVVNGYFEKHPKEQEVVRIIMNLRSRNNSFNAIANHLNCQKIPPRRGDKWEHSTISLIVKRVEKTKDEPKGKI